jgi:DMSO/TMAO reductase YedYZ heme-binding membrane subunit
MTNQVKANSAGAIISIVMIFGLAYAMLRYHIAGPVPWKDFPFFILNKGISLSAFILLTCNFGFGPLNNLGVRVPEGWLNARKAMGMTGFLLVLIHALMSFMLFSPSA